MISIQCHCAKHSRQKMTTEDNCGLNETCGASCVNLSSQDTYLPSQDCHLKQLKSFSLVLTFP